MDLSPLDLFVAEHLPDAPFRARDNGSESGQAVDFGLVAAGVKASSFTERTAVGNLVRRVFVAEKAEDEEAAILARFAPLQKMLVDSGLEVRIAVADPQTRRLGWVRSFRSYALVCALTAAAADECVSAYLACRRHKETRADDVRLGAALGYPPYGSRSSWRVPALEPGQLPGQPVGSEAFWLDGLKFAGNDKGREEALAFITKWTTGFARRFPGPFAAMLEEQARRADRD